jgi:hypothetical protein
MAELILIPTTLRDARAWINLHHSHHRAPQGGMFSVGVGTKDPGGGIVMACIAIFGKPVARMLNDDFTGEITRVASDRTPHAASKAVAAITRMAGAGGYTRLVSYTLLGEAGTSYRAAGWWPTARTEGGEWSREGRGRKAALQVGAKVRWEFGSTAQPRNPVIEAYVRACSASSRPVATDAVP